MTITQTAFLIHMNSLLKYSRTHLRTLFALLLTIISVNLWAGTEYVRVTKASEINEGDTIIIVYKTSTPQFYNMFIREENINRIPDYVEYNSDKTKYKTIEECALHCHPLKVVKDGTSIALKDLTIDMYLCRYKGSKTQYGTLLFAQSDIDENCFVTFEEKDSELFIKIDNRNLRYQEGVYRYTLRTKKEETGFYNIAVYKLKYKQEPQEYVINRTFSDSFYNTLMLPLPVENYKSVFGEETSVYQIREISDTELVFEPMEESLSLKENTPYLIKGTFNTPPYSLGLTDEKLPDSGTKDMEGLRFVGAYEAQTLTNADAYVLYEDVFYNCKTIENLEVSPFKWYIIVNDKTASAPRRISFYK